jgi:hypothetical protein
MLLDSRSWLTVLGIVGSLALSGCQKKADPSAKADPRAVASAAQNTNAAVGAAPVPAPTRRILMVMEYRNQEPEYVHSAWFMDTAGNEYRFVAKQAADDLLLKLTDDSMLTGDEIERLIAASKSLPKRVTDATLAPALKALNNITQDPVEDVSQSPCNEVGQTFLFAYVLEPRLGLLSARYLRGERCSQVVSRNPSPGASELADWLEKLGKPKLLPI